MPSAFRPGGATTLPSPTGEPDGDVLTVASGLPSWLTPAAPAAPWDLTVNLPLTTGTGWAMPTGFTNDGTKMIAGLNTPQVRNGVTTPFRQDASVFQVEIQVPSGGRSAADQRAGFGFKAHSYTSGSPMILLRYVSLASPTLYAEVDAVSAGPNIGVTAALSTWHTLRCVSVGLHNSFFLNGTFIYSSRMDSNSTPSGNGYFFLYAYQIDAWFRNLKVWNTALPA